MRLSRSERKAIDAEIDKRLGRKGVARLMDALLLPAVPGSLVYVGETDCLYVRLSTGLKVTETSNVPDTGALYQYNQGSPGSLVYGAEFDTVYVRLSMGLQSLVTSDLADDPVLSLYAQIPLGQPIYIAELDALCVRLTTGFKAIVFSELTPVTV